jgi:hypothetical protein
MRNPFGVVDVSDPMGAEVERFASALVTTKDPALDENATAWVATPSQTEGIAGAWTSRWRTGDGRWQQGVSTIQTSGERIFILHQDGSTYLIEATVRGDRFVGRYVNVHDENDTSPWVGVMISPHRIDGYWRDGRWDLRRCSPDERPEPLVAAVLTEARQLSPVELRELLGFARYLRWRRTPS